MMNSDLAIDLHDVCFVRDGKEILRDISWQVEKGQNWVVLGPNGSGKTTLLNIVAGYVWPTSGEVSILGNCLGKLDLRELRKKIGWVSSTLKDRMPARLSPVEIVISGKYATLGLWYDYSSGEEGKTHKLLQLMDCKHLVGRKFDTLSYGEKQRVLIARALMAEPELLILDETCIGLDIAAREDFLSSLERLSRRKDSPTIIYVTHHIDEVTPLFTHALLLKDGEVYSKGILDAVLTSEGLSAVFGMDLDVGEKGGRYWWIVR